MRLQFHGFTGEVHDVATAVFGVVAEQAPTGELDDVSDEIPEAYEALFEAVETDV